MQSRQQNLFSNFAITRQNWSMEIRAVDVFIDCALTAVFTIVAMTGNDLAKGTLAFAQIGLAIVIFKTMVFLTGFFIFNGNVADKTIMVLA